ncbi:MAG: phosphatase PAP2 family protein [Bacteroidota bacterium]
MKQILSRIPIFILLFVLFWAFLLAILIPLKYEGSFLWLNGYRTSWLDALMPHLTHLGDGVLLGSIAGLFLARKKSDKVISMITSLILVSLVVALLKSQFFSSWSRPLSVFEDGPDFFFIGLKVLRNNSFPSGHSAAIVILCVWLAWIGAEKRWQQVLWAILGMAVCYSRVYIGVHFPADILVGSILAIAVFVMTLLWIFPSINKWYQNLSNSAQRRTDLITLIVMVVLLLGDIWRLYTNFYQA